MSTLVGGMFSLCCHMALVLAFMHLYTIFNLRLLLSILTTTTKSSIETPDGNGQWYQHLLTLLPFFMTAIPKGLTVRLCLCILCLCNVHDL